MKNKPISCENNCGREAEIFICQPCQDEHLENSFQEGRESVIGE